jgi:hypothetical protein
VSAAEEGAATFGLPPVFTARSTADMTGNTHTNDLKASA